MDEFENGDDDLYPDVLPEGEKGDELREPDFDYYHTTQVKNIFQFIILIELLFLLFWKNSSFVIKTKNISQLNKIIYKQGYIWRNWKVEWNL